MAIMGLSMSLSKMAAQIWLETCHVVMDTRHISLLKVFSGPCPVSNLLQTGKQGKPRKTWSECVKTDVRNCGLAGIDPQDRDAWRAGV